jgi:hypothetical protein
MIWIEWLIAIFLTIMSFVIPGWMVVIFVGMLIFAFGKWYLGYCRQNPSIWQMRKVGVSEPVREDNPKQWHKIGIARILAEWLSLLCLLIMLFGWLERSAHQKRVRERTAEKARITNAIETFKADQGRYPTNLGEICPTYYAPSNWTYSFWTVVTNSGTYSATNESYDLKFPPGL